MNESTLLAICASILANAGAVVLVSVVLGVARRGSATTRDRRAEPTVQTTTTTVERGRNHNRVIAAGLTIGFGIAALTGCASNAEATPPKPVATAVGKATPSQSASPEASAQSGEYVGEVLEQTKTVEEMDSMSLPDYAKLGYADHFAYAYAKVGDGYPVLSEADDKTFTPNAIPGFIWQVASGDAANNADPLVRAKIFAGFNYYTTDKLTGEISAKYQESAQKLMENGGAGMGSSNLIEYVDSGKLQHGTDRDGNPIDFYNVTDKQGSNDEIANAPEHTTQAIRVVIKLKNGQTVVTYATGYGVDGHQSPDDRYPY